MRSEVSGTSGRQACQRSAGIRCNITTPSSSSPSNSTGAKAVSLSINNKGGHVCRLIVNLKGSALQVDQPNANSDLKAVRLAASTTPVEAGKWHKAVIEVHGPRMIAQIDDAPAITWRESARRCG